MAAVVKEVAQSRRVETVDGRREGMREFVVYDETIPIVSTATIQSLFGTATTPDAMPAVGTMFPDDPGLFGFDYRIDRDEENPGLWRVSWNYRTIPVGANPNEPGYVEFHFTIKRELVPMWRTNPELIIPAGGDVTNTNWDDISGQRQDSGGAPGTGIRLQQVLQIVEVYETIPPFALITAAVGKRNSQIFQGAAIGSVLMLPCETVRIGFNRFAVTYNFAWDEFFHMVQVPLRTMKANVEMLGGEGNLKSTAKVVAWRQPFPDKVDFNALSGNWT